MRKVYLFVDDERIKMFNDIAINTVNTDISCYMCKNYKSSIERLKAHSKLGDLVIIDLDHDLGEKKTGYDIAKYIVENKIPLFSFKCHSMNLVGKKNIEQLLIHYGYKKIN